MSELDTKRAERYQWLALGVGSVGLLLLPAAGVIFWADPFSDPQMEHRVVGLLLLGFFLLPTVAVMLLVTAAKFGSEPPVGQRVVRHVPYTDQGGVSAGTGTTSGGTSSSSCGGDGGGAC